MRRASHPVGDLYPPPGPRSVVLKVDGPLSPGDVGSLCGRLRDVVEETGVDLVTCDVGGLSHPGAGDVDAVARLQLTARHLGRSIRLRHVSSGLRELLDLFGLQDAVPCPPAATSSETAR
jgi:ABC-type transporter Mla MlaB component